MSDKSLVLVDGSSYLYRAFHALPDLRSPAGEPTGAIYGVLNMLRRLVNDYKADFLGCVFDAKGKTFRDEVYPEYKANRQAMPDELAAQIEPLMEAIRAMGWPLLVVDGVEADDVIATLAKEATAAGIRTVISTGDKDLAQLVDPQVTLINTMSNETLDVAGVQAKFGVAPEQIIDYLALVGDSVDNIPGVEKVGPKTAAKWIAQYGSLEGVLAHADEIGGVVGENLRKVRDWLGTARELVTVKRDVALPFKVADLAPRERDRDRLAALFQRFGFKSWLRDVQDGAAPPAAAPSAAPPVATPADVPRRYETLLTEADLARWLPRLAAAEIVSFDTETTSLDPFAAALVGVSFSIEPGEAAYLAIAHAYTGAPEQLGIERAVALLRPWLEDESKRKLGQNSKYDQHVLANHGVRLAGIAHDTLL
ncbi:MAG: 5'-3' exonuclease H3TH domain-containing protein, partial [Bacteroidota bacterium]